MAENVPLERRQRLVLEHTEPKFREELEQAFAHGWTLAPGALAVALCWDHAGNRLGAYAAVVVPPGSSQRTADSGQPGQERMRAAVAGAESSAAYADRPEGTRTGFPAPKAETPAPAEGLFRPAPQESAAPHVEAQPVEARPVDARTRSGKPVHTTPASELVCHAAGCTARLSEKQSKASKKQFGEPLCTTHTRKAGEQKSGGADGRR